MGYLIGVDEAGYGPNLGPLVITATVWSVPDDPCQVDLYEWLAGTVQRAPARAAGHGSSRVTIDDSKALYQPGRGLATLERGVLASLNLLSLSPSTGEQLWNQVVVDAARSRESLPWQGEFCPKSLPVAAPAIDVARDAETLAHGLALRGVRLVTLRSRAVFPADFNDAIAAQGNKAAALSRLTLGLVAGILEDLPADDALVVCDKHGGRNRYSALLQEFFPDWLVEIRDQSRAQSTYRWGRTGSRVEARFCTRGESHLPVALASMTSKYLRELEMLAFNQYWARRVPNLRPTAGYPQDARRFKREIAAAQQALCIDDHLLWRCR